MRSMCFTVLFLAAFTFAAAAKADSTALSETLVAAQDSIVDTIYVIQESFKKAAYLGTESTSTPNASSVTIHSTLL